MTLKEGKDRCKRPKIQTFKVTTKLFLLAFAYESNLQPLQKTIQHQ